jgi:hypothetical protein
MPETIAEYIDRLCTIEARPAHSNLPRGVIHRLYAAARADSAPLTLQAAEALVSRVSASDTVFILTGAGGPPVLPNGEVDGVPGTAALARALTFSLGARVVVLTEERVAEPMRAACWGAGLNFTREAEVTMANCVRFIATPIGDEPSEQQAHELLKDENPAAVIAVEKLSPNQAGMIHGATGLNYHDTHTNPRYLFEGAAAQGILTIGIGDGGNEVGFGRIFSTVQDVMPAGRICHCPCRAGSAAAIATDVLVVGAISNWAAYGVSAMIGWLTGNSGALVDADDVERMITDVVAAGAFDGAFGRPTISDDGVSIAGNRAMVTLLRTIVDIGRSTLESPGH